MGFFWQLKLVSWEVSGSKCVQNESKPAYFCLVSGLQTFHAAVHPWETKLSHQLESSSRKNKSLLIKVM